MILNIWQNYIAYVLHSKTLCQNLMIGIGKEVFELKKKNIYLVVCTGCSLSDQHILSPINPKYNI